MIQWEKPSEGDLPECRVGLAVQSHPQKLSLCQWGSPMLRGKAGSTLHQLCQLLCLASFVLKG